MDHPRSEPTEVDEILAGDIVWIAGPDEIQHRRHVVAALAGPALPPLEIEEPTVFHVLPSQHRTLTGSEGRAITLRQIKRPTRPRVSRQRRATT